MSFISPEFVLFFSAAIPLYFALPHRFRWAGLLVASYVFYAAWNASYIILLAFTTAAGYISARMIAGADDARRRRLYLLLGLGANLALLFFFKYFDFFVGALNSVFTAVSLPLNIGALNVVLPAGISFYTFLCMGYILDVYRGAVSAEKHAGLFGLFIAFWPPLISGPIERAERMLPQFRQRITFDEARAVEGLRLILWGAFKKVVIADRLAIYVNAVYNHPQQYDGPALLTATFFLAFQIYADFSGYSDIAIGAARVMGFDLMLNFRQPYFSGSVLEFWRRWHISLTSWIREFLFIPLSRSLLRRTNRRYPRLVEGCAYLVVMLLVGLWHGATWTFVVWGGLHGVYMGLETLAKTWRVRLLPPRLHPAIAEGVKIGFTFALVCFAWIFFRANSLNDAVYIIGHVFDFPAGSLGGLSTPLAGRVESHLALALAFASVGLLVFVDALDSRWGLNNLLGRTPGVLRWSVYYASTILVLAALALANTTPNFIYFQF